MNYFYFPLSWKAIARFSILACSGCLFYLVCRFSYGAKPSSEEINLAVLFPRQLEDVLQGIEIGSFHYKFPLKVFSKFYGNEKELLNAFMSSWAGGIRHYIVKSETNGLAALCLHIKAYNIFPTILSLSPSSLECSDIFLSLDEAREAHLTVLVSRIKDTGSSKAFVILDQENHDSGVESFVGNLMDGMNVSAYYVYITKYNDLRYLKNFKFLLRKFPNAPVLFASGISFYQTMDLFYSQLNFLKGRTILSYLNALDKLRLLNNLHYRRMAENLALISTAQHDALKRIDTQEFSSISRTFNASIIFGLNVVSDFYDKIVTVQRNLNVKNGSSKGKIKIERLRMIPQRLLRPIFVQQNPWVLEAVVEMLLNENEWVIDEIYQSLFKILKKKSIIQLSQNEDCQPVEITMTAMDPSLNFPVTKFWNISNLPQLILLPTLSPKGFSIIITCGKREEVKAVEIGCLGISKANTSLECILTRSHSRKRRYVKSFLTDLIVPIDRVGKETKLFRKEKFKTILPQIASCIGSTGGCAICYVYLLYHTIDINPGVCYGACGVAVGGSCTSLISNGFQTAYDYSVICSELFRQGRIKPVQFIADSRYGSRLSASNPLALKGYQVLAAPVVSLMKSFLPASEIVYRMALPWIHHMEFKEGLRDEDNKEGKLITMVGIPVCSIIGFCSTHSSVVITGIISVIVFKYKILN